MSLPFSPQVMGIDEAGRGPLAGPVVVAGVLLPQGFDAEGIRDSKKLSAIVRVRLAERIRREATYAIAVIEPEVIDRINIREATHQGMVAVARQVAEKHPGISAVVDGNVVPWDMPLVAWPLVKGDDHDAAIAAASILAKTTRDALMEEWGARFPEYGFEAHSGYHCQRHIDALRRHGPCPIHRRSFEPIRTMVQQLCLALD